MDNSIVMKKSKELSERLRMRISNEVLVHMKEIDPEFDYEAFEKEI